MSGKKQLSLGSLFDGIGAVPYAASFYGINPAWASEILPEAISVTRRHFPEMIHVGDITKLHGGNLPPVEIIAFGSPCQGGSLAGKRKGLADERSRLFLEAIRIIDEMREATNGRYPRFTIWENVPGFFVTNSRRDFKSVLEAFTKTEIPLPKSGRWTNAGMVRGGRADIAWCVYAAQYFGVPQRRRRIFLVADFGGERAAEILFVPKSLSGYFKTRGKQGQGVAADAVRSVESAERSISDEGVKCRESLSCSAFCGGASPSARSIRYCEHVSPTFKSGISGSNMIPCICEPSIARTLTARGDSSPCADRGQNIVAVLHPKISGTICASGAGLSRPAGMASETDFCVVAAVDCRNLYENENISGTLQAKNGHGYSLNYMNPIRIEHLVRRLTPMECELLMNFPSGWTEYGYDGKRISDTKRYQLCGNSIVVSCVAYIIQGIIDVLEQETPQHAR